MGPTEGDRIKSLCDLLETSRAEATPVNKRGLPGIFLSARMGLGDIFLDIDVQRSPTSAELSSFAWHFRNFAERMGYPYMVSEGAEPTLHIRLASGETLPSYRFQVQEVRGRLSILISKMYGNDPTIFREYLQSIDQQP